MPPRGGRGRRRGRDLRPAWGIAHSRHTSDRRWLAPGGARARGARAHSRRVGGGWPRAGHALGGGPPPLGGARGEALGDAAAPRPQALQDLEAALVAGVDGDAALPAGVVLEEDAAAVHV